MGAEAPLSSVELHVQLRRLEEGNSVKVHVDVSLSASVDGSSRTVNIQLPPVSDAEQEGLAAEIASSVLAMLGELGAKIMMT